MWHNHPNQIFICVLFITLFLIASYISRKRNKSLVETYKRISELYPIANNTENNDWIIEDYHVNNDFINEAMHARNNIILLKSLYKVGTKKHVIHFLGLFELTTRWGKRLEGYSEMSSAQLAVKHINSFNILPGYTVELIVNDTKCDNGIGMDRLFHAIYSSKTVLMLLGSSCSNVTETLAHIVPYWNILQVSFGSTSPTLSDRKKFPLFFRTVATDSSHNLPKIYFIKRFKWKVVAAFSQSENEFLLPLNSLVSELESFNVSCTAIVTFSQDNYVEQLKLLKNLDTRIILGSFSSNLAPIIFCEVYKLGMFGSDYVWILQYQHENWWTKKVDDCDNFALKKSVNGLIFVSEYNAVANNMLFQSNLMDTASEMNFLINNISDYSKQAYDAVWAMALVLQKTLLYDKKRLSSFNYKRNDIVCSFVKQMSSLNFLGLSGPVKFNGADRIGNSIIRQIQNGQLVDIAIYEINEDGLNFTCKTCKQIKWKNGQIPIDHRKFKTYLIKIPHFIYYTALFVSTLGIITSVLLLYFNLHYRKLKIVKLSSPTLSNVTIIGCILIYLSMIFLTIEKNVSLVDRFFGDVCMVQVFLLSAGFSLAYGSMFAKTYRVHRIFSPSGSTLMKNKMLKDEHLIAIILIPILVDAVIFSLWIAIDPFHLHMLNLSLEHNTGHRGIVYQPQVEICRSDNTYGWFIAIYGYKGLILILGVFMAWETRHVKIPSLNDSRYTGISVYCAVFCSIIVILSSLMKEYFLISYLSKTFSILALTTVILILLYYPKLRSVLGKIENSDDMLMQRMGLKIECNTRRFVIDEQRELISRLEIQNKVYKCEIQNLEREIIKLEEYLEMPTIATVSSSYIKLQLMDVSSAFTIIEQLPWPITDDKYSSRSRSIFNDNKSTNEAVMDNLYVIGNVLTPTRLLGSSNQTVAKQDMYAKILIMKKRTNSTPEVSNQLLLPIESSIIKAKSQTEFINRY